MFPLAFIVLAALQTAAAPAQPAVAAPAPIHVADLHLTYAIPAGLAMDPALAAAAVQAEKDKASGEMKATMACVTSPVMAADPSDNFRMVALVQIDFTCLGQPATAEMLSTVVSSTLTESLHRFGEGVVTPAVKYTVGGYPAAVVRGSVKSEKFSATFHGSATCVLVDKGKMGCWEFIALTPEAVDKLAAAPVNFEGHDPLPLVPADIAAKTK